MKRRLLLGLLVTSACHGSARVPASASTAAWIARIDIGTLPRGRAPRVPLATASLRTGSIPGLAVMTTDGVPSFVGDATPRELQEDGALRDPSAARSAYCVSSIPFPPTRDANGELVGHVFFPPLPSFDSAFRGVDERGRAERIEERPLRLHLLTFLASRQGAMQLFDETRVTLAPLLARDGVEAFAFFDETEQSAHVVVRRPPLRAGRLRYVSFAATDTDGGLHTGSCTEAHIALPITRGGATAVVDVGVEVPGGARPMRVFLATLALSSRGAELTTRMEWAGPTESTLTVGTRTPSAPPEKPDAIFSD